jgi:hypothetical protein
MGAILSALVFYPELVKVISPAVGSSVEPTPLLSKTGEMVGGDVGIILVSAISVMTGQGSRRCLGYGGHNIYE